MKQNKAKLDNNKWHALKVFNFAKKKTKTIAGTSAVTVHNMLPLRIYVCKQLILADLDIILRLSSEDRLKRVTAEHQIPYTSSLNVIINTTF